MANLLKDGSTCVPGIIAASVQILPDENDATKSWLQLNFGPSVSDLADDADEAAKAAHAAAQRQFIDLWGAQGNAGSYGFCLDSRRRNGAVCGGITWTEATVNNSTPTFATVAPWGVWVPWMKDGEEKVDKRDWFASTEVPKPTTADP